MAVSEQDLLSRRVEVSSVNSPQDVLGSLSLGHEAYNLYKAGAQGFQRPFARDQIISAELSQDTEMLEGIIRFSAFLQGEKKDPRTGEEPGKIFHEYDIDLEGGIELLHNPGYTTLYAACDTTALFLTAHESFISQTRERRLADEQAGNIRKASEYILSHVNEENLFVEDPSFSGADKFALKVTYWKDSELNGRVDGNPSYPIIYPLVHIQNLAGLRSAAKLLDSDYLLEKAEKMKKSINYLYRNELGNFPIAIDREGEVDGISSDGLHTLFYLEPEDITTEQLLGIVESSQVLETDLGYRSLDPKSAQNTKDVYHAATVWTHEQAQIHKGAKKHLQKAVKEGDQDRKVALEHVLSVSGRMINFFKDNPGSFPEIFVCTNQGLTPSGNDPQLWAVAAQRYYENYLKAN